LATRKPFALIRSHRTTTPMNLKLRFLPALLLAFAACVTVLTTGCVSVNGNKTAGKYAYLKGTLESTMEGDLDKLYRASNDAVKDLQFAKISDNKDALLGVIVARNAADKKVEITLDKVSDTLTKVRIKVGTLGDETLSLAILDKIKANL
jgi:hypothetical protein